MADVKQSASTPAPTARENRGPQDLSAEILKTIEKRPGDRVTCTWVSGNHYRCNWWAPEGTTGYDNPGMYGLTVTTHRVRQSRFLSVTQGTGGLVIRDGGAPQSVRA